MKILIMSNGFNVVQRGAERYSKEMYNLLKDDHDVKLIGARDSRTKTRFERRVPSRNCRAYAEAHDFGKHVYKNFNSEVDLILNNSGFVGSYWCNKIRKKYGVPFITFERGGGREERLNNLFKPDLISYLTKHSYNNSKYKKKAHLPIGIDPETSKHPLPEFLKDKERPFVISPSALVKFKRIEHTLFAFSHLRGTLIQTSDGDQRIKIDEIGKALLDDGWVYTGKVSREILDALFEHCDLMVNASLHEAFGIVYLEAMKYNTPVVTQDDPKRREIIGKAGLYCNCGKSRNYKNAIMDALLIDWKNRPRNQALKYSWKKLKPRYIEVIESVIE